MSPQGGIIGSWDFSYIDFADRWSRYSELLETLNCLRRTPSTWSSPVSRHLEKVAQTIPKGISGEHSPANATQKPKHRQNIAWPGQPTPGKSRPNHLQKHVWRAFPGQRHPEANTSTKHGPAWSADTWKNRPNHFQKLVWTAFPKGQNIDKTWPGPVSRHLGKAAQTISKSMSREHSPANGTQRPKHRQNMARLGQPTPEKSRPNHPQKLVWRPLPGQRHPEAKTSTKHGSAWSANTQTISKSMSGEHSPSKATQKPKHRQNIARPSEPTPGKSRPNHLQKHA